MLSASVRIAVDAMGGDLGAVEVVRGAIDAARTSCAGDQVILVGDETEIRSELVRHRSVPGNLSVRHASQTILMTDKPREAYRKKPDASVVVAARMVRDGEADGFVSIGNTGAAMAASVFLLRPLPGIDRPAIGVTLPSIGGQVVMVDGGANVDCSPRQLLEFALMGSAYASFVLGIEKPRIRLLSNGEEESKGNELSRQAYKLLKATLPNFLGYVEGRGVFRGETDVVVCDGFDGNILLKTGEGAAELVLRMLKQELTSHRWMQLWLLPMRKPIQRLRDRLDYREFGGAPLLGVNGVCVVGHGRSDQRAVSRAISVARKAIQVDLVGEIRRSVAALPGEAAEYPAGNGSAEITLDR
jgi:glycerol-3-phosphate acyltransferase PlsX